MPKITVHGGPSVAGASVVGGSWSNEGDPDVWPDAAAEEVGGVVESPVEQDSTAVPDYEAWTVEQLKEQLDTRGLPKTGKKDDLVLRLLEDDDTRTAGTE